MSILLSVFFLLFGLCVGSFLNVVICRLKTKEPILFSRSRCPKCGHVLGWIDLVPVLSFVVQKGKCRYCKGKISWQYPIVEISTALIFLLITNFGITNLITTFYLLVISCFLIIIFAYDLKHYIIPDKVVYPAIIIAFLAIIAICPRCYSITDREVWQQLSFLLAAFLAAGFFLAIVLVSKGRYMGLGDVKLAVLMGLILGWPNILLAVFLAFLSGAIVGIVLILTGKKKLKSQVPFGPFLSGATMLTMLFGQEIVEWYLRLIF